MSQEDFGLISSRTYVSSLERNLKSPTLSKVDELATVLGVHPLTLLAGAYLEAFNETSVNELMQLVAREISEVK
ncbi:Cro/C1-type helix-turn-helix domain [Comamonadaceae bacterium]